MIQNQRLVKIPIILSIVMLFLALAKGLPYGYYILLKIIVCPTAIYLALFTYRQKKQVWAWVMGGIAFLFNPVIRMPLHRSDWGFFDFASGIIFVVFLYHLKFIKES